MFDKKLLFVATWPSVSIDVNPSSGEAAAWIIATLKPNSFKLAALEAKILNKDLTD